MFTIHLTGLKFSSFHGLHEEETVLGGAFEVNVAVTFPDTAPITKLEQTVDYVKMHSIIKQRMKLPTALIETVAQDLAELLYAADKRITSIDINIKKLHPPILNFSGAVGVSYKRDF